MTATAVQISTTDVPQAPRLGRIRAVVGAVGRGRRSAAAVARAAKLSARHVGYHLHAARILGWVEQTDQGPALTTAGRALVSTHPGSAEERAAFARALDGSAVLRRIAPDLLAATAPSPDVLATRISSLTELSYATARHRASTLLSWRSQLIDPQATLSYGARATMAQAGGVSDVVRRASRGQPGAAAGTMLSRIQIENFKSFARESIPLAPLTILVGANASGKSNLLDAIRFLQGLALGMTVTDVLRGRYEGGRLVWPMIRGGIQEAARHAQQMFSLATKWTLEGQSLEHTIACRTEPGPLVERESLVAHGLGKYLFNTHADSLGTGAGLGEGGAIRVALRTVGTRGRNAPQSHSAFSSLLDQVRPEGRIDPAVARWSLVLRQAMRGALFLSITPSAMRDYAPKQATSLGAEGENVSAVVRQLCEQPDGERRLVDWLSELCAPRVTAIDFVKTDLDDVMLRLVEDDGSKVSARSLSDGTLRFLGGLVALLTAPPGSLLLVEEIENGLHPQRVHLLVELLESVTRTRGVQVIATTHSPLVLKALSHEALRSTILFARPPGIPGSKTARLGDLPHFDEVAEKRGIDRLFSAGWLERAL